MKKTIVLKKGEAFNLEKEAKIINPHKMDLATTSGNTFKTFQLEPRSRKPRAAPQEDKPILG